MIYKPILIYEFFLQSSYHISVSFPLSNMNFFIWSTMLFLWASYGDPSPLCSRPSYETDEAKKWHQQNNFPSIKISHLKKKDTILILHYSRVQCHVWNVGCLLNRKKKGDSPMSSIMSTPYGSICGNPTWLAFSLYITLHFTDFKLQLDIKRDLLLCNRDILS